MDEILSSMVEKEKQSHMDLQNQKKMSGPFLSIHVQNFYHSIGMPVNMSELGIEPTEKQLHEMAKGCTLATGSSKENGSAVIIAALPPLN